MVYKFRWLGLALSLSSASCHAEVLFLAHFDGHRPDADYAASGVKTATAPNAARCGELGYFPGTPSGAVDVGDNTQVTTSLALSAKGNIDPRQGTIDFFLKTAWNWNLEETRGRGHPTHLFIPLESGGHIHVYTYCHEPSGQVALAFNMNDGVTDHPINAVVGPVGKREVETPWKKDEWHHVAASWTPTEMRLFADGKLVAKKQWDPPLNVGQVKGDMWIGGMPSLASRELIDELRIQDVAAEAVTVPTKPHRTPEAANVAKEDTTTAALTAPLPWYKTTSVPRLDGRVNDTAWKQIPWFGGFKRIASKVTYATIPTRFAVCYDDQALYLAVICSEPTMSGLRATLKGQDEPVFGDDAVEFFIAPEGRGIPYYQIVFNTTGGRYDGKGFDAKWNGDWSAEVARGEKQWAAELRVPFSSLGASPQPGQVWGFNVARDRYASGGLDLSSYNPVTGFHEPRSFGGLRAEPNLPRSSAAKEAEQNASYLAESRAMLDNTRALWQRQVNRCLRQLRSRQVKELVQQEVRRLASAMKQLAKTDNTLAAIDTSRVALSSLGGQIDQLVAKVQQAAPVGPRTPPTDLTPGVSRRGDLWYFVSNHAVFAVDGSTGILAGLWERGKGLRCVAAGADHYCLETAKEITEADELDDRAHATTKSDHLILRCTNPELPGVVIVKEYWLKPETGLLAKRVAVSGKVREKTLLRVSTRTYFDEAFRRDSYYERLLHPAITTDSVKRAVDITSPFAQPGFMGQASDGCSQFCASDLKRGFGIGQFLLRVNDKYAYPPRALNMSYWTPWGWEMSYLACFLKPQPFTVEMDTLLYDGDHFNFHERYLALPEWKELHKTYAICPWAEKTRGLTNMYVGWGTMPPGDGPVHPDVLKAAQIPTHLMRPDELIFYLQVAPGDNWGEFPAADGEKVRYREPNTDKFKQEVPCEEIRHGIARLHGLDLHCYRLGFYQFPIDVSPGTPPERAGWYVVDKQGNPINGWYDPSFKTYLCDMSPQFIDYMAKALARVLDYYNTDYLYLDYPYTPCFADWKGEGRVIQATDVMELYRRIHEVCQQRGKALFVNSGAGVPFIDAGYFEGIPMPETYLPRGFLEGNWRNLFSDPMLMMKLYEPPGMASYVLAWQNFWSDPAQHNGREIVNYSLLFGLRNSGAANSEWGEQLKAFTPPGGKPEWLANARSLDMYHRASMELASSRIVDVGLRPCWWKQDTELEAYALRMGPAHVLTCLSHYKDTRPVTLSARCDKLGLKPGRRTFVWNLSVRPLGSLVRQPDPPPANWDRACDSITCRSFIQDSMDRTEISLGEMPPLLVRLAAVTQVPAAIVSAYGQETQFPLPHNLDCGVDGTVDETKRIVALKVRADKPCEIVAWWPTAWGSATARVMGAKQETISPVPASQFVSYGNERFVRLALPAGETSVTVSQ